MSPPAAEPFDRLLARAAAGDEEAFRRLWRARHPPLVRYLRVMCGDAAEDVASDTWLKVVPRLAEFRGDEAAFGRWLVVVARNRARDIARRAGRRWETLAPEVGDDQVARLLDAADGADTVADAVVDAEATRAALALVASLPPGQAEMVALRVIVGMDVADVAAVVGRSPGAVRVAVHRGLRSLAARLGDAQGAAPALARPSG